MAQTLQAVFALTDRYSTAVAKIMRSQDDFITKQKKVDRATEIHNKQLALLKTSADGAATGISGMTSKLMGFVSVAVLGKKALDGMFAAINTSAMQDTQEKTMQALLMNDKIGSQLYAWTEQYAKTSSLGLTDIASGIPAFLNVTRDIGQIEQLLGMAERLAAKNPEQGAKGAIFALKEALSGDYMSLRERFGITGLSGEQLRGFADAGNAAGMIATLDEAMNKFGATQAVVDKNFSGLTMQTNLFKSNLVAAIGTSAKPVMEDFSLTMQRLNENLQAGKYEPFINVMVNGMSMIGNGMMWVAENAGTLIPLVGSLVGGLIIYKSVMGAVSVATAIMGAVTAASTGNIIQLIGVLGAVTGAGIMASEMSKSLEAATHIDMAGFEQNLAGTKVPVEISNTAPISVKGTVDIEKESIQYLQDFASAKFLAMYSTSTTQPTVTIGTQNVYETADVNEIFDAFGNMIAEQSEIEPAGVYT